MLRKNQNQNYEAIMSALQEIQSEVASIRSDVDALKTVPAKVTKTPAKKSKSAPKQTTKKAKAAAKQTAPKAEETKFEMPTKLADFEPKKYDGFYRWGGKHDGFNQKSYMGMRKAYCVFKATDGKFLDSDKAYKAGIRIDYSEGSKYAKAKKEFEKKFKYIKVDER